MIVLRTPKQVKSVRSVSKGQLAFSQEKARPDGGSAYQVNCEVDLALNDILLFE